MNNLLNEKEQRVMAALYKLEDRSVSQLSKETMINRTTLYPILTKLSEKGLVSQIGQEGKTLFDPIEPGLFKSWLNTKKEEAVRNASELETWIDEAVSEGKDSPSLVSRIKYYEGHEGFQNLCSDTWRNNKEKMIYAITDFEAAASCAEDFLRADYLPQRVAHGVHVKDIVPESQLAHEELPQTHLYLREMKLAKKLFENLGIEINLYDSKTVFFAYDKDKPCGVIIENEKITSAMKNIFEYIWNSIENK